MAEDEEDCLATLRTMREEVDWEIEEERYPFFRRLASLIRRWTGRLPDLRDFFPSDEMDWLLGEDAMKKSDNGSADSVFIEFAIRTGYRDKPETDAEGKSQQHQQLSRTTAVHRAAVRGHYIHVGRLFEIYDRHDVNYADEFGLTHFHVACKFNCYEVVKRYLELGQDPDCRLAAAESSLINPPLHLALEYGLADVVELLLKRGADPNLANAYGLTPLHVVCKRDHDVLGHVAQCEAVALLRMLFEVSDKHRHGRMKIDAKDSLGRTPLQWAVANLMPDTVDYLLDRGADLANFVFPSQDYFGDRYRRNKSQWIGYRWSVVGDALLVVERLKTKGEYELQRRDALSIMRLFVRLEKLSTADRPADDRSQQQQQQQQQSRAKQLSRRFFQSWAVEFFLTLTSRYRVPLLCAESIVDRLANEDALAMCIASQIILIKEHNDDVHDNVNEELKNLQLNE